MLLLVSVNGERWPSILSKVLGQVVGDSLGSNEDENLGGFSRDFLEVLDELSSLLEVGADLDNFGNVQVTVRIVRLVFECVRRKRKPKLTQTTPDFQW